MKTSLLLAAPFLAVAALTGCTENATDDTGSSSNDIVSGDQREGTGADYGTQKPAEEPLPELDGQGAEGSVAAKKLVRLPASIFKPDLEIPKPPVEGPTGEVITR
jgi:hypothetical protein